MTESGARENALVAVELDDACWAWFVPRAERAADVLLAAAVLLAPRVEVCEALLAGVPVPVGRLDALLVRRLQLAGDVLLDARLALRVIAAGPIRLRLAA